MRDGLSVMMRRIRDRRKSPAAFRRTAAALALVPVCAVAFAGAARPADVVTGHPHRVADPVRGPLSRFDALASQRPLDLPPSTELPAPAPAFAPGAPLRAHELLAFAPYWTLDRSGGFDVTKLSTIAYFGVDCAPDGSLLTTGAGWVGFQSEALTMLISRAHQAGDRVVLTLKCFDSATLHGIIADPQATARLASSLTGAIRSRSMDGANLDFEGTNGADRDGFTRLAVAVAGAVHAADQRWQVTVDTYAGSASNSAGFFDVGALAPAMDAIFVMAYDMNSDTTASPNAPLNGYRFNDKDAMTSYRAIVPAAKLLLGAPFYGHDWTTTDQNPGSAASTGASPQTYAQVVAAGHPVYWDDMGSVPWTAYQDPSGHWHQTWYDNAQSLALKARLADRDQLRGLGIWALGMEGGDGSLIDALLGGSAALRSALGRHSAGPPPSASPSPSAAAVAASPSPAPVAGRPAAPTLAPAGGQAPTPPTAPPNQGPGAPPPPAATPPPPTPPPPTPTPTPPGGPTLPPILPPLH